MNHCSTQAIVLQRRCYGDYDLILTLLTRSHGKQTVIAKAARKSSKRFPGILEPFADLNIIFRLSRVKGMPVLEEAALTRPFEKIRIDIIKTAYASYWAELVSLWVEENQDLSSIYSLLAFVLEALSEGPLSPMLLSVLFQIRFIGQEGLRPILDRCSCCHAEVDSIKPHRLQIDLKRGGIVCNQCPQDSNELLQLAKGTVKQLQWMIEGDFAKAMRVRFRREDLIEALRFLERFVPYHLGHTPKSLMFLRQVRRDAFSATIEQERGQHV